MNARQPMLRLPGASGHLRLHGEGLLCVRLWRGLAAGEVVDQLLHPHGITRRLGVHVQEAADIRIRGRIHINGEGGKRFPSDADEGVFGDGGVGLGVRIAHMRSVEIAVLQRAAIDHGGARVGCRAAERDGASSGFHDAARTHNRAIARKPHIGRGEHGHGGSWGCGCWR